MYVGPNCLYVESHIPEKTQNNTPLLFIHGRHGSAVDWKRYLEFFSQKGWRCYAVSLRGHYMSKPINIAEVHFTDYVQDIKEVVHVIKQPPVIIGFSMGGRIAQKYSESYQVRGMILLNSTEPKGTMTKLVSPHLLHKIPAVLVPNRYALLKAIGEHIDEQELDRIYRTLSKESGMVVREMMAGIEVDPEKISCPILVIDTDSIAKCKRLAEFYNAKSIFLKGITHSGVIWGQRWKEIATEIHNWLLKTFPP
jgi:pimeloyl-ACP methyl ester carboxylesterase